MASEKESGLQEFTIEPLGPHHDRRVFSSGEEALDRYLKQQARQEMRRHAAAVFVAHRGDRVVVGYYALSNTSVPLTDFPDEVAKLLPHYPFVPATLLGRLAVSANHRGKRLGELLLLDALRRSLEQTKQMGSVAVIVDAKTLDARKFYESYGFIALADEPFRLFLPMRTISNLFGKA